MIIRKIEKKEKKKRVAAYVRVSTLTESQEGSFESQLQYFTEFISSVPEWEQAGIYQDQGISGVSATKRPGFMRMMRDAEEGRLDLILVKSISRFARNSLEAQTYVHKLKEYGVEVRFEREQISSFDPQAEMIFNFLVTIAQEESKSISQNVRWTYERLAEQGIRHLGNNRVLGFDEVDGELTPNEDAWVVKLIFMEYADGKSVRNIADELEERGVKTLRGRNRMDAKTILRILRNELYMGDRILQKAPHADLLTHRPEKGTPFKSYYIEADHDPIVSKELWNQVQLDLEFSKAPGTCRNRNSHELKGKIICGECGSDFMRVTRCNGGGKFKTWICTDRRAGKRGNGCQCCIVREEDLLERIAGIDEFNEIIVEKDGEIRIA